MKKILLVTAAVFAFSLTASAQDASKPVAKKFYAAVMAGPAIPMGAFAAKDLNENENAGLANTGYQLNLQVGYQANNNFSVILQTFFGRHSVDNTMFHDVGATLDHWQYYGVMAGPAVTVKAGKQQKTAFDFKTMAGWAHVNSPLVSLNNATVVKEDWADAMILQAGMDIRYTVSGNMFILGSASYSYLRPTFRMETTVGEQTGVEDAEQPMGILQFGAGLGFRF